MDRRHLLCGLGWLGVSALCPAQAADDPSVLVAALYEVQSAAQKSGPQPTDASQRKRFFDKRILALLEADDRRVAKEGMGHLDFDVFYDGQDFKIAELAVGEAAIQGETAGLVVKFKNFGTPRELRYALVRQDGAWRIANIRQEKGEHPWNFVSVLQGK